MDEEKTDYEKSEKMHFLSLFKGNFIIIIKIVIIIILIAAVIYIVNYISDNDKSAIYLSKTEILNKSDARTEASDKFDSNDLIFFYIHSKESDFGNTMIEIQLAVQQGDNYTYHKKIIYEISVGTDSFAAAIPRSYVSEPGKYRVSVYLKGEEIARQDIVIN
ncbi:MAG: hypothetical protein JW982_10270 [Spirochaetes bacterium]|nr:hypothetical protein [Spirochaetota bacterium]